MKAQEHGGPNQVANVGIGARGACSVESAQGDVNCSDAGPVADRAGGLQLLRQLHLKVWVRLLDLKQQGRVGLVPDH